MQPATRITQGGWQRCAVRSTQQRHTHTHPCAANSSTAYTLLVRLPGPPLQKHAQVVEAGNFSHPCEGEAVCKLTNEKVRGRVGCRPISGQHSAPRLTGASPGSVCGPCVCRGGATQDAALTGQPQHTKGQQQEEEAFAHSQPMHLLPAAAHT